MKLFYNPSTKNLHCLRKNNTWSNGCNTTQQAQTTARTIAAPLPEIRAKLVEIIQPEQHPDILEHSHDNSWKVIGISIGQCRNQSWYTYQELEKLKLGKDPILPKEQVTGYTILPTKCSVPGCSQKPIITLSTSIPNGCFSEYEGLSILPGQRALHYCPEHNPINIKKETEAWFEIASRPPGQ